MISLHCLHGFLGQGSDWKEMIPPVFRSIFYDFFKPTPHPQLKWEGLGEVANWVNSQARLVSGPRVLVGYSWGGRVGLHSLIQSPHLWEAAIIVSAHPGLNDTNLKRDRLHSDQLWSKRFLHDPWENVIQAWNAQTVFSGGKVGAIRPTRRLEDFSRSTLATVLENCSLGKQRDLRPELKSLSVPILWISGEQDVKFQSLMDEAVALNPLFQGVRVPEAGHRVPWDQPQAFCRILNSYFKEMGLQS